MASAILFLWLNGFAACCQNSLFLPGTLLVHSDMGFLMKNTFSLCLFSLALLGAGSAAWGQQVYRCAGAAGGAPEYTNNVKDALARKCPLVSGGNVTVVQSSVFRKEAIRVPAVAASGGAPAAPRPAEGSSPEQKARDSDSRGILEAELKKSETRLAELEKEYNKGEPEKQGIEGKNHQRYLDRVNELKESITRSQSDIAGLKRELSRLPARN